MNKLEKYFYNNTKNRISKWIHYFEIYERYLSKFRGKSVKILEIGVGGGGSLKMWLNYFGNNAMVYGIDIKEGCKKFEKGRIKIFIGSQADREFLRNVKKKIGKIDVLIDDGGHRMQEQIISFEELFDNINEDGVYICEDLHTSYWKEFEGGYKKEGTFIEYSKEFIDFLHGYHSEEVGVKEFTKTVKAVHYYDSMIVIEKAKRDKPYSKRTGVSKI